MAVYYVIPSKLFWVSIHLSELRDTLFLGLGDYCHVHFIPSIFQSLNNHFVRTKPFYVTGHLKK